VVVLASRQQALESRNGRKRKRWLRKNRLGVHQGVRVEMNLRACFLTAQIATEPWSFEHRHFDSSIETRFPLPVSYGWARLQTAAIASGGFITRRSRCGLIGRRHADEWRRRDVRRRFNQRRTGRQSREASGDGIRGGSAGGGFVGGFFEADSERWICRIAIRSLRGVFSESLAVLQNTSKNEVRFAGTRFRWQRVRASVVRFECRDLFPRCTPIGSPATRRGELRVELSGDAVGIVHPPTAIKRVSRRVKAARLAWAVHNWGTRWLHSASRSR